MNESQVEEERARDWPLEVRMLDTQMLYMHALQGYVFEMGSLAINGCLDNLDVDKMQATLHRAVENVDMWEQVRVKVQVTLDASAAKEKARVWRETAARVHDDLLLCLSKLRLAMRGDA